MLQHFWGYLQPLVIEPMFMHLHTNLNFQCSSLMWVANDNDINTKSKHLLKPYFEKYIPLSIELKIFIK
jgi:hypothetical protein